MKKFFLILFILSCTSLFAQQNTNHWSFDLTTDAIYYPYCDFVQAKNKVHFAPITGPIDTAAPRFTFNSNYTIPTPLGEHWLLSDANVILQTGLQLTPVTMRSNNKISFTPFPFLIIEAGASLGIGWNIGKNIKGLTGLNPNNKQYEDLNSFKNFYYDIWAMGTFQFDTGAIIPGDWSHVVMLAQYQIIYKGLAGLEKNAVYNWQTVPSQTNGLQYYIQAILAYQMPLVLYRAGIMNEFSGHYDGSDYGIYDDKFKGNFTTILISPFVQFKFKNEDTLSILFQFSNRRSFKETHKKFTEEIFLTTAGQEWFVNMIAASWTHYF